jgi:UDP-glucose 4-epimerase
MINERVLVTGGAGFIGSNLVDRLLAEGHAVDVVDDLSTGSLANLSVARADPANDFRFHRLDVRSDALVDLFVRRQPEVVFHLAGSTDGPGSVNRPVVDADVNILGSLNVLEGARAAGAHKVVYASGSGGVPREVPNAVSKEAVHSYLALYRAVHEVEFTALVLGSVYGPRMPVAGEAGAVVGLAERLLRGEAGVVHGDPARAADFVYVDDVVDAFARATERGGGLVLNIGTGVLTSVAELYAALSGALGVDLAFEVAGPDPAPSLAQEAEPLDPARAAIHLGWKPWTTVPEGAAHVLRWLASPR